MPHAVIKNWWVNLNPARRIDARYWIQVAQRLATPDTATREEVQAAIDAVEQQIRDDAAEASRLQREAMEMHARAGQIGKNNPKPTNAWKPKPQGITAQQLQRTHEER